MTLPSSILAGDRPSGDQFAAILTAASAGSTVPDVQVFAAGGTWTKPANALFCRIQVQASGGGGGSSGAAAAGQRSKGGGGGGGGYSETIPAAGGLAGAGGGAGGGGGGKKAKSARRAIGGFSHRPRGA